jgi:hypothetical protein
VKYRKHYTRLERLAKDKQYGLSQKFVTFGRKKFYRIIFHLGKDCKIAYNLATTEVRDKNCTHVESLEF